MVLNMVFSKARDKIVAMIILLPIETHSVSSVPYLDECTYLLKPNFVIGPPDP